MTVKECYRTIGNYNEATERLGNDTRIKKYLGIFAKDSSFDSLCTALDDKNYKNAFLSIHNLKGVYLNLSLSKGAASADLLCDALRHGAPTVDITPLLAKVKEDYEEIVLHINNLLADA